jgi:hypothetical protein
LRPAAQQLDRRDLALKEHVVGDRIMDLDGRDLVGTGDAG